MARKQREMACKRGYLLVELVVIIALNTIFIIIFVSTFVRLRTEYQFAIRASMHLNFLIATHDALLCQRVADNRVTIKSFPLSRPQVVKHAAVPWSHEPALTSQLLSFGTCTLPAIMVNVKKGER